MEQVGVHVYNSMWKYAQIRTCACSAVLHNLCILMYTHVYTCTCTCMHLNTLGGSFRHFLWQVVRELQSSVLPILLPCPSGAAGINHGKYILVPGPMTFSEEKLLQFFGQVCMATLIC